MYQAASIAAPVAFMAASAIRRGRPFSIDRLLRATYFSNTGAAIAGVGLGYTRLRDATDESLADRRLRLEYNTTQRRTDDYSMIGSAVGVLLTSLLFWKRAGILSLTLGGAGLGSAAGILVHLGQSYSEGNEIQPSAEM